MCFRQADVGEYLREVDRQGKIRVESRADCSTGGYSFYNNVVSFWVIDMQCAKEDGLQIYCVSTGD